jgi:hypothetical protein
VGTDSTHRGFRAFVVGDDRVGGGSLKRTPSQNKAEKLNDRRYGWYSYFHGQLIVASGGVRLNGRELLFGEAGRINGNTNERILSVRKITS